MFFQIDLNGELATLFIGDKLNSGPTANNSTNGQ